MKKKFKKKILAILITAALIFTSTTYSYKEAEAAAVAAAAGGAGMTVGGIIVLSLSLIAAGYGCYLVVDNWDEITSACGDFLSNCTGAVKEWWDTICGSAVKVDEPTIPLPQQLSQPGVVVNFFDYYTPKGSGSDPNNNGDKFEIDPDVMSALTSFLLTYYGYDALTPDTVMSGDVIRALNYLQLPNSGKIQYKPANDALLTLDPTNGNSAGLLRAGFVYALLTPSKAPELYPNGTALYKILDIPDQLDSIFIGVKDNGMCYINGMGFTGNIMQCDSSSPTSNNSRTVEFFYPTQLASLTLNQEPFLSTFGKYLWGAEYVMGFGWMTNNSAVNRYYAGYNYMIENIDQTNDNTNAAHHAPIACWYTSAVPLGSSGLTQGSYYYAWDNVYYDDQAGTLTCGDYHINFVGSEYLKFYSYDYEAYEDNKSLYLNGMKNITTSDGANTPAEYRNILPGQHYSIPKSAFKVVVPPDEGITVNINDALIGQLGNIDLTVSDNTDDIAEAVNTANDESIEAGEEVINQPIIEIGNDPGEDPDPGEVSVDLTETNQLIQELPQNISDALNVPGSISDAFTPSGDFTQIDNLKLGFENFFNFDILYQYHEMIETFLTERVANESPPVFKIYPKQSNLVYFQDMPTEVTVIDFSFMETEIFTWGITIRYFIRSILTFFVLAVWLNRTLKKLPGIVSGL